MKEGDDKMTRAEIVAMVDKFGADNCIAVVFDNGGRVPLPNGFVVSEIFVDDTEYMRFNNKDVTGVPYFMIKVSGDIQGLLFVEKVEDKSKINLRYATF